ncbi:MAG: 50S ribosomal protein L15 [Verrucomicrobiota bacterium]
MELYSLEKSKGSRTRRKRVGKGRASGKGKTCGRGQKGQMSRKGHKHKPGFEGGQMPLMRRIPKRGSHNKPQHSYIAVNVGDLTVFDEGAEVSVKDLRDLGLAKGNADGIKILGRGSLDKKLMVRAQQFSAAAKAKIEDAGGSAEVVKN